MSRVIKSRLVNCYGVYNLGHGEAFGAADIGRWFDGRNRHQEEAVEMTLYLEVPLYDNELNNIAENMDLVLQMMSAVKPILMQHSIYLYTFLQYRMQAMFEMALTAEASLLPDHTFSSADRYLVVAFTPADETRQVRDQVTIMLARRTDADNNQTHYLVESVRLPSAFKLNFQDHREQNAQYDES